MQPHGLKPALQTSGIKARVASVAVLSPREAIAELLAAHVEDCERENWAPFRAWRGKVGEKQVFVLVCGEGPKAAVAGALQLMATCPGAPIVQLDECLALNDGFAQGHANSAPDGSPLKPGELIVIESACAFNKEEYYLLHASPTPLERLPRVAPKLSPMEPFRSISDAKIKKVKIGSCEARIDFPSQRRWLRDKYGFDAFDTISHAVGAVIEANGGVWMPFGLVASLAGEPRHPSDDIASLYAPAIASFISWCRAASNPSA